MIDLPAMGYDGTDYTLGYISDGQVPKFMVYKASSDSFIEIEARTVPVWENNLITTLSDVTEKVAIPSQFMMHNPYPNPFNPITEIAFEIKNNAHVQVRIYDVSGKEVSVLENGLLSAGSHKLIWDAANYSSGVYLMSIVADGISSTQKLMLMK